VRDTFHSAESKEVYEQAEEWIYNAASPDATKDKSMAVVIYVIGEDLKMVGINAGLLDALSMTGSIYESISERVKAMVEKEVTDPTIN
jgi:hypothetical protein